MSLTALVAAVALLIINGFFVAAEFALIAVRRTSLERLEAEGSRSAGWALSSSRELSVMLAGAQLGVTLASVVLGFVAEPAVAHLLHPAFAAVGASDSVSDVASYVMALAIVIFAHMVLGEMVPKNLAIAAPDRTALVVAGPLRLYRAVLGPVITLLNLAANTTLRILHVEPADELASAATADDLASMIGESRDEGMLGEFEEDLLRGALHFGDEVAASVMVPQEQIVAAPAQTPAEDLERLVVSSGRTRIPLYEDDLDHVVGFLHSKALIDVPDAARHEPISPRLVRPMVLIPATRPLQAVLAGMRKHGTHVALVTADNGSTVGLLTLQDVLERLVGQVGQDPDQS